MIECIFTVDYEIYGNGRGSLRHLVWEPAEALMAVFKKWNTRCVIFVEAAELEMIGLRRSDSAIDLVEEQVREFHDEGFEIGLHLHPQWYNAKYADGIWQLDYSEYNLCLLSHDRINEIMRRSITYLQKVLRSPAYIPRSFRAGNWLLQPTEIAAELLVRHGIKIDSSVFKGGLQSQRGLDYRKSQKNGYFWTFSRDVNMPDPRGSLLEIPTFTKMVPVWKMFTAMRFCARKKEPPKARERQKRFDDVRDLLRTTYPMKLDYCRLSAKGMISLLDEEVVNDQADPAPFRPIVAIGHTKDLEDPDTLDSTLSYLQSKGICVSTFMDVLAQIAPLDGRA